MLPGKNKKLSMNTLGVNSAQSLRNDTIYRALIGALPMKREQIKVCI